MIINTLNIGTKPAGYPLAQLAEDIVAEAPVEELVRDNYGGIWAHIPCNDEINASMAMFISAEILRTCVVEPRPTFLAILAENVGTDTDTDLGQFTAARVVENLPDVIEKLETLMTERLKQHDLQTYVAAF